MTNCRPGIGIGIMAVRKPCSLFLQPMKAPVAEQGVPARQIIAAQLIEVHQHHQTRRLLRGQSGPATSSKPRTKTRGNKPTIQRRRIGMILYTPGALDEPGISVKGQSVGTRANEPQAYAMADLPSLLLPARTTLERLNRPA